MFTLKQLVKKYDGAEVLSIEDMSIPGGEICCISGPNGAGKTTFLEILAGLQHPTSGQILFRGQPLNDSAKGKIIMVLQNPVMFNTTVQANLAFGLKVKGTPHKDHDQLISTTLDLLEIGHLKKRKANQLSGGEKQRVAIARALVLEPEVLIMDEPTAGLDTSARAGLIEIIKRIDKIKNITSIIASHDRDFLLSLAGTAFTLIRGKHAPISVENFLHGTVIEEGVIELQNNVRFFAPTPHPGKINAVIAPENIVLSVNPIESSMRNRFQGHVTRLEKDGDNIKVYMDTGVELCSRITPTSLRKMNITIGDNLWLEFKATAVQVY